MEKRVFLQADVDEGRLKVVLKILHTPLEHGVDEALLLGMLDHELLESAVLNDGHACFELFNVDDDLALHLGALQP